MRGEPVLGDVPDRESLRQALDGAGAAYHLVHSLDREDFEEADARAARDLSVASAAAGVRRTVQLGGLGHEDQDLSAHLRSRREVEHLLAGDGVPVPSCGRASSSATAASRGRSPASSSTTCQRWSCPTG